MPRKMIFFGEPDMGSDERRAIEAVLRSNWIGFGNESIKLEREVVDYLGVKDGALLNSCTAALHLALILNGVMPSDEIITTPLTFAATANVVLYMGAKPVFVDIKADTLNIDEDKIEKAITPKTKGIIVVHFGGLPCNMRAINRIARKHNIFVVEDAAHAIGARIGNRMVGDSSNITCFSFYANKNLTTADGGFLASNDSSKIKRAKILRLHGLSNDAWDRFRKRDILINEVVELGYKYNINDIVSAMGRVQLRRLEKSLSIRERYARLYDAVFSKIEGVSLQSKFQDGYRHSLHLYTLVLDPERFKVGRDEIVRALRDNGIFAVVHYKPIHLHKLYREKFGYELGNFLCAERVGSNILTLPLLPQMSQRQAQNIASVSREILQGYAKRSL